MRRLLRSAWVIGRRDFTATVLSKTFIFFLLGPLFPLLLGGLFGGIGAQVASRTEQPVIAVMFGDQDYARLAAARERLAAAMPGPGTVRIVQRAPLDAGDAQVRGRLQSRDPPVRAVLTGSLASPHLTGAVEDDPGTVGQLKLIIADARSPRAVAPVEIAVTNVAASSGSLASDRAFTAQIGQMLLFFLTVLLSGMLMSQLIEEKSNKIVEVIAAAVPIDAMFIGKLFAMLASSIVGIVVWISAGALLIQMIKHGGLQTLPPPAVGWPAFLVLAVVYFAMNYLLLGAVFLTIGAQATTAREVQTLSMPVTFGQVLLFGFASTAIGAPDSVYGLAAAGFPLSSPMAMLARAAERPELWTHVAALLWQALWVAIILRIGAQLFRKTVLKSGPRTRWWKRKSVA
jgi:ABC-2 type transport system permease protein